MNILSYGLITVGLLSLSAQGVAAVTGEWHLQSYEEDGVRRSADVFRNEELRITPSRGGGLEISNRRVGFPMTFVETGRSNDTVFYTSGPPTNPQQYRFSVVDDRVMTVSSGGETLTFNRQAPQFPSPKPAVTSNDHITLSKPFARQHWYQGFNAEFESRFGTSFETCFSDPSCRRTCDATNVCQHKLFDDLVAALNDDRARDNLFADNEAGGYILGLAWVRQILLDLQAQMHRRKDQSLLKTKTVTLDLLNKLIEDGSPPIAGPSDDPYFAQALEVVGCTAVGFVPGVGDILSLGCGIRGLSTLTPGMASPGSGDGETLSSLFMTLRAKQDSFHDRTYNQWDDRVADALKSEDDKDKLYAVYTEMQQQFDKLRLPSEEQIKDSIFDAVWPYAFFLLGTGEEIPFDPGADGICDALLDPASPSPVQLLYQLKRTGTPAYWMMSLHYGLDGSSFFYKQFAKNKSLLVAWSLQIGSIDKGVPLGNSTMAEFNDYLGRNPQLVFKKLWDGGRVYVRSPYAVRNHIAPAIHHHNPNFVEYDADNLGTMVWPPADQQTEDLDDYGFIRASVKGRGGRSASPALRCMSWR